MSANNTHSFLKFLEKILLHKGHQKGSFSLSHKRRMGIVEVALHIFLTYGGNRWGGQSYVSILRTYLYMSSQRQAKKWKIPSVLAWISNLTALFVGILFHSGRQRTKSVQEENNAAKSVYSSKIFKRKYIPHFK